MLNPSVQRARASTKPAAIRAAAQRLFLESGLSKTSMDAIAAEANVTKQTVYRYYGSKNELFSAVLSDMADRLQADILDLIPSAILTPAQLEATLILVAQRILDHILEPTYVALVRVVIAEAKQFPELPERLWVSFIQRGAGALARLLHSQQLVNDDAPRLAAVQRLFVGPLLSFLLEGLFGDPDQVRRRAPRQLPVLVRLFLHAVLADSDAHPYDRDSHPLASSPEVQPSIGGSQTTLSSQEG